MPPTPPPRERAPLSLDALLLAPSLLLAAGACVAAAARHFALAAAATVTLVLVPLVFRLWTRPWYRGLVLRGLGLFIAGMHLPMLVAGALAYGRIGCEPTDCGQTLLLGIVLAPVAGAVCTVVYWVVGRPPV
ncbi:hypothetical protein D7Y13_26475 [Corallococcus praedator]|uniref:Lipoprotein n=1 Tax=Corallococcus praedator TaxID=2316724 RepID=A0ABX9QD04_9BACT|nr:MULTISPECIES: hypothetical protein [Corallococcus]RKH24328.1 hypothetical protein D7X75_32180 [Corallococcus sp. CA031C]RKI00741.1 hypothetical protein D7Y13_26475 [Corallococcus praedator]